jgi:hypothetical protein
MRIITLVASVTIALLLTTDRPVAQEGDDGVSDFSRRVAEYVALHRQIERLLPKQKVFTDPAEGLGVTAALAQALRGVRAGAREGDIFSPLAAVEIRRTIGRALAEHRMPPSVLIDEMQYESDETAPRPAVNEMFSWRLGNVMPYFVLHALPELPEELQYRFVERDLVLIDIHADLVVDILRDALPEETYAN